MEEEVELRDYINVLLKWKKLIIGITILAMLAAGVMSYFVIKPVYQASGALLINPRNAKVNITTPEQLLNPLTFLPEISVATYQEIVKSKDLAKEVLNELNLPDMNVNDLNRMITIENPNGTTMIRVLVDSSDPVLATKIVNVLLDKAVIYVGNQEKQQMSESRSSLTQQFTEAKGKLEVAQKALADFDSQEDNLTNLTQKRSSYSSALNSYRSQLLSLDTQIRQYEEQLGSVERQLKQIDKYFVTEKSIMDDPLLSQLAQQLVNENIVYLSQLKVSSQSINPLYEELHLQKANYTITLSGLNAKKKSLQQLVIEAENEIHRLDQEINAKQLQLNELNRNLDLAQSDYSTIKTNYQQSQLAEENILSPVTILENPVVPMSPIKPKKLFNIAVSGVAAFFFAILLAFFLEYWYGTKEKKEKKKPA